MTNDQFKSECGKLGLKITDFQAELLLRFINLFIERNKSINLTKITNEKEFIVKHILDSLIISKFVDFKPDSKVADIGTGGGLPGIPLAILFSDARFVLIDPVQK